MTDPPQQTGSDRWRRALWGLGLAALYLAATWLFLRPTLGELRQALAPDLVDPVFNLYVLEHGAESWRHGLAGYWDAPFFYPAQRTITLSDHLMGPSLAFVALEALLPGPIAAYNTLLIAAFVISGLAVAYVLRASGSSGPGAAFGGFWFIFSPYRTSQLCHLQMLLVATVPLTLWFFHRLLSRPSWRRAAAFLAIYLLHVSGGNYLAYMIHLPLGILLLAHLGEHWRELRQGSALGILLPTGTAALAFTTLLFRPYLHDTAAEVRKIDEWRAFGATTASFLAPGPFNWHSLTPLRHLFRFENALLPGLLIIALAITGLWGPGGMLKSRSSLVLGRVPRGWLLIALGLAASAWTVADLHTIALFRGSRWLFLDQHAYRLAAILLIAAALAAARGWQLRRPRQEPAGPALSAWERGLLTATLVSAILTFPVPFAMMAKVLPGLDHMRVPTRFYTFVSFGVVWLAARGWDGLATRWAAASPRGRALAVGLALLAAAEIFPRPPAWNHLPTESEALPVYSWLRSREDVKAVVEVPFGEPSLELQAMYAQRFHRKPIVNGYSGFYPPGYQALLGHFRPVPDPAALAALRRAGVSHLLLHRTYHWRPPQRERIAAFAAQPGITLAYDDSRDQVFVLARTAPQDPTPPP